GRLVVSSFRNQPIRDFRRPAAAGRSVPVDHARVDIVVHLLNDRRLGENAVGDECLQGAGAGADGWRAAAVPPTGGGGGGTGGGFPGDCRAGVVGRSPALPRTGTGIQAGENLSAASNPERKHIFRGHQLGGG